MMDLQLFAEGGGEERSEQPTPRRRRKAREKGEVFQSKEIISAAVLLFSFIALWYAFTGMSEQLQRLAARSFGPRMLESWGPGEVIGLMSHLASEFLMIMLPVFAVTAVVAAGGSLLQTGLIFAPGPLSPKFSRIDPVQGAKRMISLRALVNLGKSLIKVGAVGYVAFITVLGRVDEFPLLLRLPLPVALSQTASLLQVLLLRAVLVLGLVGAIDYFYERSEHEKSMRMTRRELKDEMKETEGDPQVRGRRRGLLQQAARQRMITAVPAADVVVTNPTQYAVALKYEFEGMEAPRVVARGRGLLAKRIREVAEEHGVTVQERPPLARALYEMTEVGDYIPRELYEAVAEVLAYVYRRRGKAQGRGESVR
ncbi:MAG: flagellar biosynthesis protein FlhB [Bacillota bacterium]